MVARVFLWLPVLQGYLALMRACAAEKGILSAAWHGIMPSMILVTGGTGFVGRHLVSGLAEASWPVRVFMHRQREGDWPERWAGLEVEAFSGDLYDRASLLAAMDGVHTVYHLASAQWWGRPRDLERVDVGITRLVASAAVEARVGRLVFMSHLGAASSSAYPLIRAKGFAENAIRGSGVPYTIIRSGIVFGEEDRFVNGVAMLLRTNPAIFLQPGQGENLLHPLHIHDLARALVGCMDNLDTVDRVLEIGGPEYVTFNEMVRTVMRITRTPRTVIEIPPHSLRLLTRVVRRIFPRWPTTHQWFDMLASHRTADLNSMSELFGIKPVRFEDTLLTYMPARRYTLELLRFLVRRRRPRGI